MQARLSKRLPNAGVGKEAWVKLHKTKQNLMIFHQIVPRNAAVTN
jgi:hypothetical protein